MTGARPVPSGSASARELEPCVRPAGRPVPDAGPPAVGPGDELHNRQAEPCAAAGAPRLRAAEALERVRDELGRNAGAVVEDVELGLSVVGADDEVDRAAAVAERVLDEVRERLLDSRNVDVQREAVARGDRERTAALAGAHAEAPLDALHDLARRGAAAVELHRSGVAARDEQEVLREVDEAVGLGAGGAQ